MYYLHMGKVQKKMLDYPKTFLFIPMFHQVKC